MSQRPKTDRGVHIPTGKAFCVRLFTCGYCGHQWRQGLSNSFEPCSKCYSVRKVNHTKKAKEAWPTREVEPIHEP